MSLMAALSETVLTINMLHVISVFFLTGDLGACPIPILIVDTPGKIEALSGTCLLIPCSFNSTNEDFRSTRGIYGLWLKGTTNVINVIFNSSWPVNNSALEMIGNLHLENCTTLFSDIKTNHTDQYFLRIQNGPKGATAKCHPLQISVRDTPWSPSIKISADDLKEHQSVTITCSALTPCPHSPPELTWNLQQDSDRQTEKNKDGTFTTKIQETITLSDTHDGYNISCSARYPVNGGSKTAETEETLSVSYAPKDTSASISPSGLVSAGSWVELSCSSRAKPPASSFTWFRNSKHGAINVSVQNVLRFRAIMGGEYYCTAINNVGNGTSPVINVSVKGLLYEPLYWAAIPVGCIVFICLFTSLWFFNSKNSAPQPAQCHTMDWQRPAPTHEEELHYGEITFSKKTHETSSAMVQDNEHQETVYAKLKGTKQQNGSTQTADTSEDLCHDDKQSTSHM